MLAGEIVEAGDDKQLLRRVADDVNALQRIQLDADGSFPCVQPRHGG